MAKTAWHDMDTKGRGLNTQFVKLLGLAKKTNDISENVSISNSLGQLTAHMVNLKTSTIMESKIDKIEQLLAHIPKQVLAEAKVKAHEHK